MKILKYKSFFLIVVIGLFLRLNSASPPTQEREKPNWRQSRYLIWPDLIHPDLSGLNNSQPFQLSTPLYKEGEVLVKFKSRATETQIKTLITLYGSRELKKIPRIDVYQLEVPHHQSVHEMVNLLRLNPEVEFAEPNYYVRLAVTPNDPLFRYQYALYNPGGALLIPGSPQGKSRADIRACEAWEETKGTKEVIIAIVDSGIDLLHPDIKDKIRSSGRDFVNNDFDATDDHGHGTHVSGIAAAATNNNEGIAGVAWNCQVLPLKVIDKEGSGLYSWVAEAIIWAADNKVDVINLSIGGTEPSQTLESALRYAYEKNVVIIAAAGNDGGKVLYPAAYDNYCLAVAATDYNDTRPEWSNYGPEIDVAAPGVRVVSLVPRWYFGPDSFPYGYGTGTSMAAPHVAGLAALIKSLKPWLRAREILDVIRYSCEDVNALANKGRDNFIGYGRINMEKALVPIKIKK